MKTYDVALHREHCYGNVDIEAETPEAAAKIALAMWEDDSSDIVWGDYEDWGDLCTIDIEGQEYWTSKECELHRAAPDMLRILKALRDNLKRVAIHVHVPDELWRDMEHVIEDAENGDE